MRAQEFITEGADFLGYYLEKRADGKNVWTWPDGFETANWTFK